jgi:hypothetical protein
MRETLQENERLKNVLSEEQSFKPILAAIEYVFRDDLPDDFLQTIREDPNWDTDCETVFQKLINAVNHKRDRQ